MEIYYNIKELSKIYYLLDRNMNKEAEEKINEYILKHPEDTLGYVAKAELLLNTNKPEEALNEIIKYKFKIEHGYNRLERVTALYGKILIALGRDEDGLKQFYRLIEEYKNNGYEGVSLGQRELIRYYMSKENFDKVLEVCNMLPKNPEVYYRQGLALAAMGRFKKAVESYEKIESLKCFTNSFRSHYYYNYAKSLLNIGEIDKAYLYFEKCLQFKNDLYDRACYYMGFIHFNKKQYAATINFANRIINNHHGYDSFGYSLLIEVMMQTNQFDEIEELIKLMPSEYWRSYYTARLCFAKKEYEKAEKLLCTMLSTSTKNFNENMDEYIKCKYRLGKYEETLYTIENLKEQGYEPSAGVRAIETYLNAEKYRLYELPYRIKQVRDYDREFAIHYTAERFGQEDNLTTLNNDDIRLLFTRAEKAIADCEGKADGLYDKYLCYYKKVGKERGKENKESLNYLEVVTVPNTKEIIFAYPKIGVNEPLRKNNFQTEKVLAKKCKYIGVCDKKMKNMN